VPLLTVFTPTYNRAYCLNKCYESLLRQTSKDFAWIIIDDGSTDNTKTIVSQWINEKKIIIQYYYQENQGMHGAHNTAYELCETELNVCIDSDDYMTDNAVELIVEFWNANKKNNYAGIIALDCFANGEVVGKKLPSQKEITLGEYYYSASGYGDKKLVYRTVVIKKYPPYPVFLNEKYSPLSYKYLLVDQEYKLLIMNKKLCVVEYMEDGSSLNIFNQYRKNPKGFAEYRKTAMLCAPNYKRKFVECVHYVSSSIICKKKYFLRKSPCKITTFLAIPFGFILYLYIINTSKK